jgi:multidrug efflux pump subunit AcrB
MGIAKKNSILLVEFFNRLRFGHEKSISQAILEGGPVRLRPILMTSVATVAAAVPAAIGFGPGAEVRESLAIVIIGGVIISTIFTLMVIPCVYSLCTALESKTGQIQSRRAYTEGDTSFKIKPEGQF